MDYDGTLGVKSSSGELSYSFLYGRSDNGTGFQIESKLGSGAELVYVLPAGPAGTDIGDVEVSAFNEDFIVDCQHDESQFWPHSVR